MPHSELPRLQRTSGEMGQPSEPRAHVRIPVRCLLSGQTEITCQTVDMSLSAVSLAAPHAARIGEAAVLYVEGIGRLEGRVVRVSALGFVVRFGASAKRKSRIADVLTWLVNKDKLNLPEERRHARVTPHATQGQITLEDGQTLCCRVLDVSLSGAAVRIFPFPPVGALVFLGKVAGRVVRHFDEGIGIKFLSETDIFLK